MSLFSWFSAKIYDRTIQEAELKCLKEWRAVLIKNATGAVLEIGPGTGSNIEYYPNNLIKLVLLEPNIYMHHQLAAKLASNNSYPVELLQGQAELIPFKDASFNTIVCTLVLCSVKNIEKALSELYRVLAPEGKLIFIEHVVAKNNPRRRKWQHLLEPIWKIIASGCHLTRQTEDLLIKAGFNIENITHQSMRGVPPIVRPSIRGVAIKRPNKEG